MYVSREVRNELNALSKEVFGVASKWQTIMKKGKSEMITRKTIETVPGKEGEESTANEIEVPVLTPYGAKQFVQKYYTLEEVREIMLTYKTQLDTIKEQMRKQQEEKTAKEEQEKAVKDVHDTAYGSAVK